MAKGRLAHKVQLRQTYKQMYTHPYRFFLTELVYVARPIRYIIVHPLYGQYILCPFIFGSGSQSRKNLFLEKIYGICK